MYLLNQNSILKKSIFGLFLILLFLAPISLSITIDQGADVYPLVQIESQQSMIHAQGANSESGGSGSSIADWFFRRLGHTILTVASSFTWLGGTALEGAIKATVFEMGARINGQSLGNAIDALWGVVRDISNLAFIFGFLYVGIRTILDPDGADTKKFLSRIIIGALLINFSLFFVKFIVDFSNFLAFKIFTVMTVNGGSISAALGHALGIPTIFSVPSPSKLAEITGSGEVWFFFLAGFFLFISAFVFIASAILFINRFVALILIMIFSPVLFAATVFSGTANYAADLWKKLIGYAFFAPLYLFLILISLRLLEGLRVKDSGLGFMDELKNAKAPADTWSVIMVFSIAIGLMIAALMLASKMGVKGGDMVVSIGKNVRGRVQSAIGRTIVGGATHWAREKYEKFDANTKDKTGWKVLKTIGKVATLGGIDDRAVRETLKAGEHAKFGGSYSYEDDEKYDEERKGRQGKIKELDSLKTRITEGNVTGASDEIRIAMERAVAGASGEQLLTLLKEYKPGSQDYKALVANITSNQFDSLMKLKPEELDDSAKAKLASERSEAVTNRLINEENRQKGTTTAGIEDVIGKADGKDLDALGYTAVYENALLLTLKQIDDMSILTPTAKARLKEKRSKELVDAFNSTGPKGTFDYFKDVEAAKLPKEILIRTEAAEHINVNILNKMLDNDSLTADDRAKIRKNILDYHAKKSTLHAYEKFFDTPNGNRY